MTTQAEARAKFIAQFRQSIEDTYAAAEQHKGTFVLVTADDTLALIEDGNQFRLGGFQSAEFFESRSTAEKVARLWNSQDQVKASRKITVTCYRVIDGAERFIAQLNDLIVLLDK